MVSSIRVDRNVLMRMRDGVVLRANIYRPDDSEKHPAIVIWTPYNKAQSVFSGFLWPIEAALWGVL